MEYIIRKIVDIPDFPRKGVNFKDITPILQEFDLFQDVIVSLSRMVYETDVVIDKVVGIESRGFILGPAIALSAEAGFVPVRKKNKLPRLVFSAEYELEYGREIIDIHQDAVKPGENVVIVDDVLATGGTALAAAKLVEMCGGVVKKIIFLMELTKFNGREKLGGYEIESLIKF